jgi:hypothetical protein
MRQRTSGNPRRPFHRTFSVVDFFPKNKETFLMPTILPTDWRLQAQSGATPDEYQTLALLAERLPGELTVFHGLRWTHAAQNYTTQRDELPAVA